MRRVCIRSRGYQRGERGCVANGVPLPDGKEYGGVTVEMATLEQDGATVHVGERFCGVDLGVCRNGGTIKQEACLIDIRRDQRRAG